MSKIEQQRAKRNREIVRLAKEKDEFGRYRYGYREIGRIVGMPQTSCSRICRSMGFVRSKLSAPTLTRDDIQEIHNRLKGGELKKDLANEYGVSQSSINYYGEVYGIRVKGMRRGISLVDEADVCRRAREMLHSGATYLEIEREVGFAYSSILAAARRNGIMLESRRREPDWQTRARSMCHREFGGDWRDTFKDWGMPV